MTDEVVMVVPSSHPTRIESRPMNTIIYIVGLVVIVGAVLSYFGYR